MTGAWQIIVTGMDVRRVLDACEYLADRMIMYANTPFTTAYYSPCYNSPSKNNQVQATDWCVS